MMTFAILHGSGDGGWAWQRVCDALRARGHEAVAPDLPTDRDDATWAGCVAAVADAVGPTGEAVVVGHSGGGFLVPGVADRLAARLQIHVAGMVPTTGETPNDWFAHVGWSGTGADPMALFYEDVPADLAAEAMARERPTSERLAATPCPVPDLPSVPVRYVVTARDRFLPPALQRRVAADRLGIADPDEIDAGHCAHLSRPEELAELLVDLLVDSARRSGGSAHDQ